MFKKIISTITNQVAQNEKNTLLQKQAYSERFDDPLADKTAWNPLVPGGTSFRTHKLQIDMRENILFKASIEVTAIAIPYNPAKLFVYKIPATIINAGIAVASIEIANPCITFVP